MNEWKQKTQKDAPKIELQKKDQEKKTLEGSNSYTSDDFEEVSASGSGSKSKLNFWPGKDTFKKSSESASVSQSKDKDEDSYDPKMMEQYIKKQQQSAASNTIKAVPKTNTVATHD